MTGLAFSTTVTRDFIVTGEFFKSVLVDRIFASEFNRSARRDDATPLETGAGTTILVDSATPIEWLRIVTAMYAEPSEYRSVALRDVLIPSEWRGVALRDTTVPIEWGLSAQVDTVALIDFNMSRVASPEMPVEWGAVMVLRDAAVPLEASATAFLIWPAPAEWQNRIFEVVPVSVDWSMPFLCNYAVPVEASISALGAAIVPLDFSQPAQMSTSFAVPLEFVNQVSVVYDEPTAIDRVRVRDATIPAEWTGNVGVILDAAIPLEWRSVFATDAFAPVEWRGSMTQDTSTVVEWGFVVNMTPVTTVDFNSIVLGESFIVPDADAGARTEDIFASLEINVAPSRDFVVPIANSGSSTGSTGDATAPMEFGGGLGSPPYPTQVEFGATAQRNVAVSISWLSTMLSEPEVVAENTLSVIGESFVFPDVNFDIITADYATPLEWSAIGISVSATFEVERVAAIVVDTAAPADWFGTSLSADIVSLIDWTQDTSSLVGDASVPINWTAPILVDVVVGIEEGFGRKSIGAALEPDEWERERD